MRTFFSTTTSVNTCNATNASEVFNEAMKTVGDFWTLRIIDSLNKNELRFCGLERAIPEINPATLSNRLKKMEEAGLVVRRVETVDKQSVTYMLSAKGKDALPILRAIKSFTQKYV